MCVYLTVCSGVVCVYLTVCGGGVRLSDCV